ncbi:Glycosyltransferase AglD [Thermoplasmatales archaeon]|nr:Glycosyltransferase AglD [Thermoplasmatales archaeon]
MLIETMEHVQTNLVDPLLMKKFSIIIPAYNEDKRITPVLNSVVEFISSNLLPWQVIVSIDGEDGTEAIVRKYSILYPFIQLQKADGRNGKGGAIKRSLYYQSDYTILMDADNSVSFDSVVSALPLLKDHDLVILSRYNTRENRIPVIRRFLSWGFSTLSSLLLGIKVRDKQSGYKIFRTELFLNSIRNLSVTNAFFDAGVLYYVKKLGGKVIEVPVKYNHDNGSTFTPALLTIGMGVSLFAFAAVHSRFARFIPVVLKELYYQKFKWI